MANPFGSFDSWRRDLAYAARTLRRASGFSSAVVLMLSLGVGAGTAVFCALDHLLLRALPYPEANRLVALHETQTGKGFRPVSLPNLLDWRGEASAFDGVAGFMTRTFGLRGGQGDHDNPIFVATAGMATSDFFHVLGIAPRIGRTFSEKEEQQGRRVVILSDAVWAMQFDRQPGLIGRTITLNEEPYQVIGILPPEFEFPDPARRPDLYIPMNHRDYNGRGVRPLEAVARVRAGVDLATARAQLRSIGARLAKAWPEENVRGGADLEPLDEAWKGGRRRPLMLLTAAALLLLAIVCTNVINLMASRALARRKEMAIRAALGAGAAAVIRQMIAESFLLCLSAGLLGAFWAALCLRGLPAGLTFLGASQPIARLTIDPAAVGFAAILCVVVTMLCGLIPGLALGPARIHANMKQGGEAGVRRGAFRLRKCLVAGQIALSLVLLLSAGAFLRVFALLLNRDPGFTSSHVYYFGFGLPEARYSDRQTIAFHRKLRELLQAIPGIETAGAAWQLPLNGRNVTTSFQFEGQGLPEHEWSWVACNIIDPAYIPALHIPLLAGRNLSWDRDMPDRPLAVLVNRTFERRYGPVLGRRLQLRWASDLAPKGQLWEVVGIVADTYQMGLDKTIRPQVYLSVSQTGLDGGHYVIRTARDDAGLNAAVSAAVRAADPSLERIRVRRLSDWVSGSLGDRRTPAAITTLFAGIGLLLTVVGLYGAIALEVRERRREMAIRAALGASPGEIARMVIGRGTLLTSAGIAMGLAAFLFAGRLLEHQLYGIEPWDPANAIAVIAILIVCAIAACLRPAREGARADPVSVLRDV